MFSHKSYIIIHRSPKSIIPLILPPQSTPNLVRHTHSHSGHHSIMADKPDTITSPINSPVPPRRSKRCPVQNRQYIDAGYTMTEYKKQTREPSQTQRNQGHPSSSVDDFDSLLHDVLNDTTDVPECVGLSPVKEENIDNIVLTPQTDRKKTPVDKMVLSQQSNRTVGGSDLKKKQTTDSDKESGHDKPAGVSTVKKKQTTDSDKESGHDKPAGVSSVKKKRTTDSDKESGHDKPAGLSTVGIRVSQKRRAGLGRGGLGRGDELSGESDRETSPECNDEPTQKFDDESSYRGSTSESDDESADRSPLANSSPAPKDLLRVSKW